MSEMTLEEAQEYFDEDRGWSIPIYLACFFVPAILSILLMKYYFELDMLFSGIVALAVMNGSINSVIAYLTIRLDDKSSESLQHLEFLNNEMDRLENTLEEANTKVQGFTGDLEEAKLVFRKVGVDLTELDLEPVADVVEKLKENKDGLTDILDNLRDVDVIEYIEQAKRINWKQLLSAAEEVMGFIQTRSALADSPIKDFKPKLPAFESVPADEEVMWVEEEYYEPEPEPEPPKPKLSLQRKPKKNLVLKRN